MGQYQRLFLIGDSRQLDSAAFRRAAAIARQSGASLHIGLYLETPHGLALLDERLRDSARQRHLTEHTNNLQRAADELHALGVTVTREVLWSQDALGEILARISALQPDLVIKDIQHEPVLKRAFVTPLDCHLLRACPVPLHLVAEARHPLPYKVLAAVDVARPELQISGLNEQIIQTASALALQCGAELHLLHACDLTQASLYDAFSANGTWDLTFSERLCDSLQHSFNSLAEKHAVPAEQRHFLLGPALAGIAEFVADFQVDVVVMGTVSRHGLERMLGSTTEHMLYRVPSSLLTVRSGRAP